jgi:hypothetical protein
MFGIRAISKLSREGVYVTSKYYEVLPYSRSTRWSGRRRLAILPSGMRSGAEVKGQGGLGRQAGRDIAHVARPVLRNSGIDLMCAIGGLIASDLAIDLWKNTARRAGRIIAAIAIPC